MLSVFLMQSPMGVNSRMRLSALKSGKGSKPGYLLVVLMIETA